MGNLDPTRTLVETDCLTPSSLRHVKGVGLELSGTVKVRVTRTLGVSVVMVHFFGFSRTTDYSLRTGSTGDRRTGCRTVTNLTFTLVTSDRSMVSWKIG